MKRKKRETLLLLGMQKKQFLTYWLKLMLRWMKWIIVIRYVVVLFIPCGYIKFVKKNVIGRRRRGRPHKVYTSIPDQGDKLSRYVMSVCPSV